MLRCLVGFCLLFFCKRSWGAFIFTYNISSNRYGNNYFLSALLSRGPNKQGLPCYKKVSFHTKIAQKSLTQELVGVSQEQEFKPPEIWRIGLTKRTMAVTAYHVPYKNLTCCVCLYAETSDRIAQGYISDERKCA